MLVVSTKQFKDNPLSYFDQIDQGMEILIRRGKYKTYRIVQVDDSAEDAGLLALAKERRENGGEHTGIEDFIQYMKQSV